MDGVVGQRHLPAPGGRAGAARKLLVSQTHPLPCSSSAACAVSCWPAAYNVIPPVNSRCQLIRLGRRNGRRPIRRQLLGANGDLSDDGMPLTSSAYLFPVSTLHLPSKAATPVLMGCGERCMLGCGLQQSWEQLPLAGWAAEHAAPEQPHGWGTTEQGAGWPRSLSGSPAVGMHRKCARRLLHAQPPRRRPQRNAHAQLQLMDALLLAA